MLKLNYPGTRLEGVEGPYTSMGSTRVSRDCQHLGIGGRIETGVIIVFTFFLLHVLQWVG